MIIIKLTFKDIIFCLALGAVVGILIPYMMNRSEIGFDHSKAGVGTYDIVLLGKANDSEKQFVENIKQVIEDTNK